MPINDNISRLFREAKQANEFEFICTLINYKGMGSRISTSNLHEWFEAIEYYKELYINETNTNKKTRIGLLLYSTFFESSDLYNILGSLTRVVLGFRSAPYLYFKHPKADRWYGTSEKISLVNELLIDSGFEELEQFFEGIHQKSLRNTFFHSAYSLEGDGYQLHDSEPIMIEDTGYDSVSITNFILPKIDTVIEFFDSFKTQYLNHYQSYNTNRVIRGRFPTEMDITILGNAEIGLSGFTAGGSSIQLENDFWTGMNIRFDFPSEIQRFINEEINRQINKENVRSNDGSLQKLYDVITDRNIQAEKENLSRVYARFAIMFREKANSEENPFKKTNLYQHSLNYYEKMYELDSSLILNQDYATMKFVVADRTNDDELRKDSLKTIIDCIDLDNLQENILRNTLHIITALRERRIDISQELLLAKRKFNTISTKEFKELINEIKNLIEE